MPDLPESVAAFLQSKRIAVAGVSRDSRQTANGIFRKLRDSGYEVIPVNPNASRLEDAVCYPDLQSIPGELDAVMAVTHPDAAMNLVRQCAEKGVKRIWFHRSFGAGSVSDEAVKEAGLRGIEAIAGGCPFMYCKPVDPAHACIRTILRFLGRVPA